MQMNLTNINTSLQSMSNVFVTDRLACKREAIVDHVEAIEPLVVVDIPHFVELLIMLKLSNPSSLWIFRILLKAVDAAYVRL